MTTQKHVVVVGSGIVGASIAWHLAAAGARVTVVEAGDPGGVATPCSFAWINASWGNPERYVRLRMQAMAEWRRLAAAVPTIPLAWCGGLSYDLPPDERDAYLRQHGGWGYGIRRVDRAEALAIEPHLAAPPEVALHIAGEGMVEPVVTAKLLLEEAGRRGARIAFRTRVTRLVETGGATTGAVTEAETLEADEVVIAAGIGTPALAATAGFTLPMTTPAGLLVHSEPHARLLNGLVMAPDMHMRQTAEGRIVAGADYGGGDPGDDPEASAEALFAAVKASLTGAEGLALGFHTIGYRPTPADGFPVVGRPGGRRGLYLAVMHSGVTLAAAIGRFVAEEVLEGRREPLLEPYGPDRLVEAA